MPRPVCTLCGAENSWSRIYVAMGAPTLNLLGLACRTCGRTATQLHALGDYIGFALIYAMITGALIIVGMAQLAGRVPIVATAAVAAVVPMTFLPIWWASRMAQQHERAAPRDDLPAARKAAYALLAVLVIAACVGGMLLAYLKLRGF